MPKATKTRFTTDHDLLVVLVTNQENVGNTLAALQRTQQNLVSAVKVMASHVKAVGGLGAQINDANQQLSAINAKLGIKALEDIEKRNVRPSANVSEAKLTDSSGNPIKLPEDKAAVERKRVLDKLKDWATGLTQVGKILFLLPPLIIALGGVVYAVWKVLAWLQPGHIPPPPNQPMVLPK
jgi:hypothetical protein